VRTYGLADPAAGRPVDDDTLFEIGSISKSLTAICILRLWEGGRLDLRAEVQSVLPWFPFDRVTIHQLLSHTGGLVWGLGDPPGPTNEILSLAETARAPAGADYGYSNIGYLALGAVIERLTGEPFANAYRCEILGPLELTRVQPLLTNALRGLLAVGHEPVDDTRPWRLGEPLAPVPWVEYRGADGSVCATAEDLVTYGRLFLNDCMGVLSAEGFALLTTPVAEDTGEDAWYGYGVMLRTVAGRRWIGHSGGMLGHYAQLWCDMDAGLAVSALVNGRTGSQLLADYALRLAAGDDVEEPSLDGLSDPAAAVALDAEPPAEWLPMCGLYRSHNPWTTTIRVGTSAGRPLAIYWGDPWPMTPLPDGSFRLGANEWSPERLRFDTPLEGRFMRARHGASAFHRPI
jgi:CubicO group peptidase (beta-lactamase class C family)